MGIRCQVKALLKRLLPPRLFSFLKKGYRALLAFPETYAAPFIAFRIPFVLWPLYKICQSLNICFLANIPDSDGVGHILVEVDDFLRKRFLNELDRSKKYILIKKSHWLSKEFVTLYRHHFDWAICNTLLYYLTLPLIMRYETLRLDCGLSRSKWHPIPAKDQVLDQKLPSWPKIITKHRNLTEWENRYRRRVLSADFTPLRDFRGDDPLLNQFLKGCNKIALLHLKTNISNATALPTDPNTYVPPIEYLLQNKYQLVFAGREKMPPLFQNYPILNYAESDLASFSNDIRLFSKARLAITGGSGIFFFAECLNIDLLYVNYWHIYRLPATPKCLCVPTLIQDTRGRLLSFAEQWDLYKRAPDAQSERFSTDHYFARNATAEEILQGCRELLEGNPTLSPLQLKFKQASDYYCGEPRISDFFLQQHQHLLNL
jgi:putative glycosyltransferase (TIGR04372 family)